MGPRGRFYSCDYIGLLGTGFMQVLYLGRAPRTKETLPNFREICRVTRHSRVFRGLTGTQRTPGFGASDTLPTPLPSTCSIRLLDGLPYFHIEEFINFSICSTRIRQILSPETL